MRILSISTACLLLALGATNAMAQPASSVLGTDGTFVGATKGSVGCPAVKLHILRAGGALSGVVFYADGSGISSVKGTTDGKTLKWMQTSVSGHGPTGEVTGKISSEGTLTLNKTGTSCDLTATLPMYNDVTARGG